MRYNRLIVWIWIYGTWCGMAYGSDFRERIPLDKGWQVARSNQGQTFDQIPSSQVQWKDHQVNGMPLPAQGGEVFQGWYRCRTTVPADWQSGTVWLRMENWKAARVACWVNGQRMKTEYWTGFLPAEWRVDEFLKAGSENEIVLCFWSLDWARVELKDKAITRDSEAGREFAFLLPEAKTAGEVRYLVPTAYGNGDPSLCFCGPTGPIVLERRSKTFIDHILTQPSIEGPKLTVRTEIVQGNKGQKDLSLRYELYDGKKLIAAKKNSYQAGNADTFICPGAELWWPNSPKLYRLEITLYEGATPVDKQCVTVGFREVKAQGRKVLLNGVVYNSFGAAAMALDMVRFIIGLENGSVGDSFWHPKKENIRKVYRFLKSQNIRMIRLGQALYPEVYFEAADEEGFLLMAESALCNSCANSGIELDEFWQHWRENMLGLVRRSGNHPSILVWSLGNEVGHGGRGKVAYPQMAKTVNEIRKLDPSRLISCSGDGDVGGAADVVNLHYPQCGPGGSLYPGQDFPRSAFWLGKVNVWPGYYETADQKLKEKPLFIGEWDTLFGHPPHTFACVYGDEAFVGGAPGTGPEQSFLQNQILHGRVIQQFLEGYRYNGVSHPSPWCMMPYMVGMHPQRNISSIAEAYAPELVMLLPQPQCFFSEEVIASTAVIFNDTLAVREYTGYFRLEVANKVANGSWGLWYRADPPGFMVESFGEIPPGGKVEKKLRFQLPPVDSPTPVRLYVILNGDSTTVARRTYEWTAYPRSGPIAPEYRMEKVGVYDPQGRLKKALAGSGLKITPLTARFNNIAQIRVIILAENSMARISSEGQTVLKDFVHRGGRLICLQQDSFLNWLPGSVTSTGPGIQNTYNFVRSDSSPVLKDITNDQLCLWGQGLLVSRSPLYKTDAGGIRYLVDCGVSGFGGLSTTTLAEFPYGKGMFLLCQMLIEKNTDTSPGAKKILMNMIRHAFDFKYEPSSTGSVLVLSKDPGRWLPRFKEAGITAGSNAEGKKLPSVIWCDTPDTLNDHTVKQVNEGATLVLYNLDPGTLAGVNKRFGLSVAFRRRPEVKKWWFANKTYRTNLLDGVGNQDLFFIAGEMVVGAVFEKIEPVMEYPIDVGSQDGLIPACDPAGLCQIGIRKGRLVFCQLNCFDTKYYKKEGRRVFQQLLYNLGLLPEFQENISDKDANYQPLDIHAQANMGFRDAVPGDAKGGWFDQGSNDLREFPCEQKTFAGIPFTIINPTQTDHKSCIILKSANTPKMPVAVTGIPVSRTINALSTLLAVSWGPLPSGTEVGNIVLHFQDGMIKSLPVKYGIHVIDWWSSPEILEGATPGWVGANAVHDPVVVYKARLENPLPEKKVSSVDVVSNNTSCPLGIIALTVE